MNGISFKPILFQQADECCGCFACMAICPKGAISKEQDPLGFFYPFIKEEKCIGCKKCIEVCPLK